MRLGLLLLAAAVVRLSFFTGLTLGDDVFYISAAAALAEGQGWPPLPLHWHTRLGMTLPTAASLITLGWHPFVFVLVPFIASMAGVWLCFHIVERVAGERAAWLAAIFQVVFPLEVLYSTHLFPDIVVGNLAALSVWLWVAGLTRDSGRAFFWAGVAFAAAYLCRETILLEMPVFAALWGYFGRLHRRKILWVGVVPILIVLIECAVYASSTGDPFYRWHAVAAQQTPAAGLAPAPAVPVPRSGNSVWGKLSDPLWMLVTSHEFSVFHILSVPLAVLTFWWWPSLRWVSLWLLVGLGWLFYGTTVPTAWRPLHPDPRYAASLTIPALLLVAAYLVNWAPRRRHAATVVLVVLAIAATSLDQRGSELTAHRTFLQSEYARSASLEPFEYYGARWALGLQSRADFACAGDEGRQSVIDLALALPGTTVVPVNERRYFVFSPRRRPALAQRMEGMGWRLVAEITGTPPPGRRWFASVLPFVPGQGRRFEPVGRPPRLMVFENPTGGQGGLGVAGAAALGQE